MTDGTLLSCQIGAIRTSKDGSVSINFETSELAPQRAAEIFALRNKIACVYISPKSIDRSEIDFVNKIDPLMSGKSPSERLRNVLFIWHQHDPQGFKDFDTFYKNRMEILIDNIKSKLP